MTNGKFKKNGVAPEDIDEKQKVNETTFHKYFRSFMKKFSNEDDEDAKPKTWKERLTFVADNAKDDKV